MGLQVERGGASCKEPQGLSVAGLCELGWTGGRGHPGFRALQKHSLTAASVQRSRDPWVTQLCTWPTSGVDQAVLHGPSLPTSLGWWL